MLCTDIIDCIGRTPLVQLRMDTRSVSQVYAKLELLNPFGMKDRVAKQMLLSATEAGLLQPGAPIIESSSGTMALGLAIVGTYLGHSVHIVTDPRIDAITLAKLQATGCIVHIVQKMTAHGWQSARIERLEELLQEYPTAFWPRQYENLENPQAYSTLAQELLEDIGRVDILVAGVGSGGSLCGTARALRKNNPQLHVVAVDAVGSVIFDQPDYPRRLQGGLGNSLLPANVDMTVIDEVHWLNDEEAFTGTLELARVEKIFAGNSSGSTYVVSQWLSQITAKETKIVALFADRGDRYFHTIYDEQYRIEKGISCRQLPSFPHEVAYGNPVTSWSFSCLPGGKEYARSFADH